MSKLARLIENLRTLTGEVRSNPLVVVWSRQDRTYAIKMIYPRKGEMLWMGDGWKHQMDFIRDATPKLFKSEAEAKTAITKEAIPYIMRWQPGWDNFIRGWSGPGKTAGAKYPSVHHENHGFEEKRKFMIDEIKVAVNQLTLRQVKSLMKQHNLPGDLRGRGNGWEIEVENDADKKKVEKYIKGLGGYKTGYGAWVLSQGYKGKGDYMDKSSPHHYATTQDRIKVELRKMSNMSKIWSDSDRSAPQTPWGKAQDGVQIANGVWWFGTAGHGGLRVSPAVAKKFLSPAAIRMGEKSLGAIWYEEDVAYTIPFYENPEWDVIFARKAGGRVGRPEEYERTIRSYFPQYFKMREQNFQLPPPIKIGDKIKVTDPRLVQWLGSFGNAPDETYLVVKITGTYFVVSALKGGGLYRIPIRSYDEDGISKVAASAVPMHITDLTQFAKKMFPVANQLSEGDPLERALLLAVSVGRQAKRLGMVEKDVLKWLQKGYGDVWVRMSGLNPGADLKVIAKELIRGMRSPTHGQKFGSHSTAVELSPEDKEELSKYEMIANDVARKLKAMGFKYNAEPESRGHAKSHRYVRDFGGGYSLHISYSPRTMVRLLGFKPRPYQIVAREMLDNFRILDKWEASPQTLSGFAKSISGMLRDLRAWIIDIERKSSPSPASQSFLASRNTSERSRVAELIGGKPKCDMSEACNNPVTHIGNQGFVYCTPHAEKRRGYENTRKMKPREIQKLEAGETISYRA